MRQEKRNTVLEIVTLILQFLTLLSVLGGGLLGYYYVHRFQANESKANTDLAKIEINLKQIESEVKEIKESLEITQNRLSISGDVMQILTDLRPKLSIQFENTEYSNKTLVCNFKLTNVGTYNVIVHEPAVRVAPELIEDWDSLDDDLLSGSDYLLRPCREVTCSPHEILFKKVTIVFKKIPKEFPVYVCVTFHIETDNVVSNTAKKLLADILPEQDIDLEPLTK